MIDPAPQTPVIVLTGFLGAGKSSLLRRLLALPAFADSGLVINEFGDVAIDHELVSAGLPEVAITSTGCICCTAGGDMRASVAEVHEAAKALGRLPLPRLVVETTGLADPAPVVNQLVAGAVPAFGLRDHTVGRHYRLAGVLTAFDAVHGPGLLSRHPESLKQVAFADRIILTKTDLINADERAERVAALKSMLARINPAATLVDGAKADLAALFAPRAYAPKDVGEHVAPWLGEHSHDHHHHAHHHHHNDGNDGTFGVRSISILRDTPVDKRALAQAMDIVQMLHGPHLLRLKGLIAFADEPEQPYVLQVVQHVVHPLSRLDRWPSDDRRTRIVVITYGIDAREIEQLLLSNLATSADAPA